MDFNSIETIELGNIILQKANNLDRDFIIDLFKQGDILENYIVGSDIRADYGRLITLWHIMNIQNEGIAWIIKLKNNTNNILSPCGFVVAEAANIQESIMISYALSLSFRGRGIMTSVIKKIAEVFSEFGVKYFEAFISERNANSISFVKRNQFYKYSIGDKIGTKMILPEDLKIKQLWLKQIDKQKLIDFYIIPENSQNDLFRSNLSVQLLDDGPNRYNFIIQSRITEKLVGISQNETNQYLVKWELVAEVHKNGNRYMVFTGWGDPYSGGFIQFEGHKIGITYSCLNNLVAYLMSKNSQLFTREKLEKVIGMEHFNL